MGCRDSTELEEDDVTLPIRNDVDDRRATQLLYLQDLLLRSRLRGDARDVTAWVINGALPAEVADNAQAIGILVYEGHLTATGSSLELPAGRYGSMRGLDERDFLRNETACNRLIATCCAIGNRKILTAGHVLGAQERLWLAANNLCVLFGYAKCIDGLTRTVFDPTFHMAKVLPPKGFVPEKLIDEEWLVLDIDRSMSKFGGRRHATVSEVPLEDGAAVYTLGHPNGLSLRYALSPATVPGPEAGCYRAFVEGYGVASGSPVFDAKSHKIVGLAVASGQAQGTVRILNLDSLSQVCTPLTSKGVSCLRAP